MYLTHLHRPAKMLSSHTQYTELATIQTSGFKWHPLTDTSLKLPRPDRSRWVQWCHSHLLTRVSLHLKRAAWFRHAKSGLRSIAYDKGLHPEMRRHCCLGTRTVWRLAHCVTGCIHRIIKGVLYERLPGLEWEGHRFLLCWDQTVWTVLQRRARVMLVAEEGCNARNTEHVLREFDPSVKEEGGHNSCMASRITSE